MGNEEKSASSHQEIKRMNQLPATSRYVSHRLRVLNKILQLLSIQRTGSQDKELELLFYGLNLRLICQCYGVGRSVGGICSLTCLRVKEVLSCRKAEGKNSLTCPTTSSTSTKPTSKFVETGSYVEGNVADVHETGGTALPRMDLVDQSIEKDWQEIYNSSKENDDLNSGRENMAGDLIQEEYFIYNLSPLMEISCMCPILLRSYAPIPLRK
ncbi:hypothetical protein SADUNF_Sadunf11G0089100 [Salix dunnii]|uniref:Uncharacterized protein n=1 Tax=Salix dunnii TaxID=1413687 RepID=A0A835JQW0_9ROSI|nr:hypothetical protein SADUNF_Sadunf11G0089100 [Salix dunnii]